MRRLQCLQITLLLTIFPLFPSSAMANRIRVRGRIIAYQSPDMVLATIAPPPRDLMLVQLNDRTHSLLKVRYFHEGLSLVLDDWIEQGTILKMALERDRGCDQSYEAFMQTLTDPGTVLGREFGRRQLIQVPSADFGGIDPKQILPCYAIAGSQLLSASRKKMHHNKVQVSQTARINR